jgi:cell division septal protein FtsQ
MNSHSRRYKKILLHLNWIIFFIVFILFAILLIYLNYFFSVKNINISFFDNTPDNIEIKSFTENQLRSNSGTFLNYIFLDEDMITEKVHKEFPIISKVKIAKSLNRDLVVTVSKNEEFFYTCVGEDSGFLVRCMRGNTDGEFYEGLDYDTVNILKNSSSTKLVNIDVNKKVLFDAVTHKKLDEPDSLSGSRIYAIEDFKVLREILRWVQKNGFQVKNVFVDELKIVEIQTDLYKVKVSLDKGYVDTVKDFETISKTGALKNYISDDKEKINYIDLSYKDKVFFKLKNDTENAIMSTTTNE